MKTLVLNLDDLRSGGRVANSLAELFHPDQRAAIAARLADAYADMADATRERIAFARRPAPIDEAASRELQEAHNRRFAEHHAALSAVLPPKLTDYALSYVAEQAGNLQQDRHDFGVISRTLSPLPGHALPALPDGTPPVAGLRREYGDGHVLGSPMPLQPRTLQGGLFHLDSFSPEARNAVVEKIVAALDPFHASFLRQHREVVEAPRGSAGDWVRKITANRPTPRDEALRRGHANHLHVRDEVAEQLSGHLRPYDASIVASAIGQRAADHFALSHSANLFTQLTDRFPPPVEPAPYRASNVTFRSGGLVPLVGRG